MEPKCCKPNSGRPKNSQDSSGFWGSLGDCDIPERTIQSALKFISSEIKPNIIFWLGDNMHSPSWNITKASEIETITKITNLFKNEFGEKVEVYPVLGNHEGFPTDMFNSKDINNEEWLLNDTANLWKNWLSDEAIEEYKKYGYYSQKSHINEKMRIIGLNSFYYMNNNIYNWVNSSDPQNQISWLEKTLQKAEQNHEKVFILEHVPICCERGLEEYIGRLHTILERYANIIKGVFAGHHHEDFIRLLKSYKNNNGFGLEFIGPSISTSTAVNPAFLVYEIDKSTKTIINIEKYLLDIKEANLLNKTNWRKSYNLKEYYNLGEISPLEISNLIGKITNDTQYYEKFCKAYVAESEIRVPMMKSLGKNGQKYYGCYLTSRTPYEFSKCIEYKFNGFMETMFYYLQNFATKWEYTMDKKIKV